jgi:integrase
VRPVKQEHIDAIEHLVNRQVWAMVRLPLLTAARPGEIVLIRPSDLDQDGKIWTYRPSLHKTEHHGHDRAIYLGPRAQQVLKPFLQQRLPWRFCFSPQEAEEQRRAAKHASRQTPASCGNRPGTNRRAKPIHTPGARYTTASYRRAIHRACTAVGVPQWSPNQLRHNAATYLRKEFGLDAARIILGHRTPAVTEIYAEQDRDKALEIIAKIG